MNVRSQRLEDFFKWFFNASPVWVDERSELDELPSRADRANRRCLEDRRQRRSDSGSLMQPSDKRSNRS